MMICVVKAIAGGIAIVCDELLTYEFFVLLLLNMYLLRCLRLRFVIALFAAFETQFTTFEGHEFVLA